MMAAERQAAGRGAAPGPLLGCIADDLTGATDLANTLVQGGMRTLLLVGVPPGELADASNYDAVVIALKSRTIAAEEAVAQSLVSLRALQSADVRQVFFKYCSTFDSTDEGNIGPVTEALLEALSADFTVACPAFPENGRTVYMGHLFVWDQLLCDSPMRDHPLTPMTDANLVNVLSRQTRDKVGLIRYETVSSGADKIMAVFAALRQQGVRQAIIDALFNHDLSAIGRACQNLRLVTGSSGLALGLPANFARAGLLRPVKPADPDLLAHHNAIVLAGSCSQATQQQVAYMRERWPSYAINPLRMAEGADLVSEVVAWALPKLAAGPVLVYATMPSHRLKEIQLKLGKQASGALVEEALANISRRLVDAGVDRLVVAGGETSGAVVNALGIKRLRIGPQIDPGVPWTSSIDEPSIHLVLKSGNFGTTDFFLKALRLSDHKTEERIND